MSCELCGFNDARTYRVSNLCWTPDGIPLLTMRVACPECGWWQAAGQVWLGRDGVAVGEML